MSQFFLRFPDIFFGAHDLGTCDSWNLWIFSKLVTGQFTSLLRHPPIKAGTSQHAEHELCRLHTSCQYFLQMRIHLNGMANAHCAITATAYSEPKFVCFCTNKGNVVRSLDGFLRLNSCLWIACLAFKKYYSIGQFLFLKFEKFNF